MRAKSVLLLIAVLAWSPAFCWGVKGHRMIVEGAFRMLSHDKQKKLLEILNGYDLKATQDKNIKSGGKPRVVKDPTDLGLACKWLDDVRHDFSAYASMDHWHFYNVDDVVKDDNVVDAINNTINKIQDKSISDQEKKIALLVLLHLVGDIHEPMHCSYKNDAGGNDYKVTCKVCAPRKDENIHHVWDDQFIDYFNITSQTIASQVTAWSEKEKGKAKKPVPPADVKEWESESFQIVENKKNYPAKHSVDADYLKKYEATIVEQLAKGSVRLYRVLDEVL